MSLKFRLVLILSAIVVLYALVEHATQTLVVQRSFDELEEREARRNVDRVLEAVQKEAEHLGVHCSDWSMWDDTYAFVADRKDVYIPEQILEIVRGIEREEGSG